MKLKVESLTVKEEKALADIWKKYGPVLKKLKDNIFYTSIIDLVETKRDKEIIDKVISFQNDVMEGYYIKRVEETEKSKKQ